MTDSKRVYLGLDVGQKRIGVAHGDSIARLASTQATIFRNGEELTVIKRLVADLDITDLVVGRPRSQSGHPTEQTRIVESFVTSALRPLGLPIHWQDESVTSILAEERLGLRKKPYSKGDVDAEAAAIILQDYLETI
jgi:putative Holliday junction resolvase